MIETIRIVCNLTRELLLCDKMDKMRLQKLKINRGMRVALRCNKHTRRYNHIYLYNIHIWKPLSWDQLTLALISIIKSIIYMFIS